MKTEGEEEEVSTVLGAISHVLYDTHQYDPYTKISLVMNIANVLLYIFDYVMDIMVVYWLHQEEKADENVWTWVVLTLVLIFVPLVMVNLFSIVWYHEDHKVRSLSLLTDLHLTSWSRCTRAGSVQLQEREVSRRRCS